MDQAPAVRGSGSSHDDGAGQPGGGEPAMNSPAANHVQSRPPVASRLLDARSLAKSFGGVRAVRDVNFHVRPGEIVGLVGPNGSGKSTLLGCLSRDIQFDTGELFFDGT